MIQLHQLSHAKQGKHIIHEINSEFDAGLVHAIIGPNGAGKSTLLNCIGGLVTHYTGDILWKNKNIKQYSPLELAQQRAYLTQQQNLAFPLTVREVVETGRFPFYASVATKRDKEIIEEMISLFELDSFLNRTYNTLSGGEKQRVQFARVFAQAFNLNSEEEKILLLDEPLSHLDIAHQFEFLEITRAFTTKHNLATIMVLHDLPLAFNYTDQCVLLNQGSLLLQDETQKVLTEDATAAAFNAQFNVLSYEQNKFLISKKK